jgi:hypothetical protein
MGNALGEPESGVHAPTLAGTAIVDYAMTLVLALATTKLTGVPLPLTTAACMLLGVLAHAVFKVDTRAARWLRGA